MNNTKTTKRALLSSVMAMLLCITMLIGTTFAWFTDSASTAINKIQAGKLDVQLLMYDGTDYVDISNDSRAVFGRGSIAQNNNASTLWEPGKTQVAYLAIKNNGNLALKYKVALDVDNVSKNLYKVMEYAITPDATNTNPVSPWTTGNSVVEGTQVVANNVSLAKGATHYFALSVHMKEEAGNDYQGGEVDFDLTVLAKQDTVEYDSNNNTYDADAVYPVVTETEFKDALNAIATKGTIVLGDNIPLIDTPITIADGKDITIDTSNYTIKSTWKPASASNAFNVQPNSVLTLKGNGSIEAYAENPDVTWTAGFPGYANNAISNHGTLVIDGATVKVTTDKVENGHRGASYCVDCYAGSKLQVKSGSIVNAQNIAVRIFTSSASDSVDVTIDGGTIEGSRGICLQLAGSSSNVAPKVNLVINGGNIKTNEPFDGHHYCNALYSYSYNNSFVNTNVTINGGNFLGYVAFGGGPNKDHRETVNITGGTFEAYTLDGGTLVPDNHCVGRYTTSGWEPIAH